MKEYNVDTPENSYQEAARDFLAIVNSPYFLNGVLASSETLFLNLQKIIGLRSEDLVLKKKTRQTIEGAVEFYSRSAFRSTPFNTFTALSATSFNTHQQTPEIEQPKTVVNLKLFEFMLNYIESKLLDFPDIQLTINESCEQGETHFQFWLQNKIIGNFQQLERNDLLDYLYEYFNDQQPKAGDLVNHLSGLLGETYETVMNYIQRLVSMGFLEIYATGSFLSEDKEQHFLRLLDQSTLNNPHNRYLYQLFEELLSLVSSFCLNEPEIYQRFDEIIRELKDRLKLEENGNSSDISLKQAPTRFPFKAFQTVYTDFFRSAAHTFDKAFTQRKLDTISEYLYQLSVFDASLKHKNNLDSAFRDYCNEQQITEVSLFKFYHYYCRLLQENGRSMEKDEEAFWVVGDYWMDKIHHSMSEKPIVDSVLHIGIDDLKAIIDKQEDFERYQKRSFSAYTISNNNHWVVDMIGMGYGMTIGRFLNLPEFEEMNEKVLRMNEAFHPEYTLAGLADDGMYNGNIHPKYTSSEIIFQRNKYYSETTEKMALHELGIRLTPTGTAALYNRKTGAPVLPLNLSLQMVNQRVGLYQFLNLFTPSITDFQPLLLATAQICELDRGVKILPRLTIDNDIIIRRKTWFFPSNQLESLLPVQPAQSITKLTEYLQSFQVPKHFFITPLSDNIRQRPLYCNLNNPLFLKVVKRLLSNAAIVKITEMIPEADLNDEKTTIHGDIFTWYVDYESL